MAQATTSAIVNAGTLTVSDSTLSGNSSFRQNGGGAIFNIGTMTVSDSTLSGNGEYGGSGGAIYNDGTMTISNSTLSGNAANGLWGIGGAIYNGGTMTVSNSTLSGNVASGSPYAGFGGAIYNDAGGRLIVSSSTLADNAAVGGTDVQESPYLPYYDTVGADGGGGGLYVAGGTVSIDHSTLAGNQALGGPGDSPPGFGYGGAIDNATAQSALTIYDTILADGYSDYGPNLFGSLTSLGHNLVDNSTDGSGFAATDLLNVNPRLGALQDNGGPTQTMALLVGSPAVNVGDNTGAPAYDQRGPGFARIFGGAIDIGAFEAQTPLPTAILISDVSLLEGNVGTTAAVFTVQLSAASTGTVSVNYTTADGSATLSDNDYQTQSGTVTFAPGETSKTITVLVNGDRRGESNETFFVNLTAATNAVIDDGQSVGTIVDDEPHISINDVSITEGNTGSKNATFTVSLTAAYDLPMTVHFATANGSATAGSDYAATSGDVTIAAGQTTMTFTVAVLGDRSAESDETFVVNLSGLTNAIIADGQGVGTIVDDEPRVSISDVSKAEGKKGKTTSFTFTVTLSEAYDQAVTMSYRTIDGTATTSDSDYLSQTGTITFKPGETSKTISTVVNGDSKKEADEIFYLDLFGNSSNSSFERTRGIGTILNDD